MTLDEVNRHDEEVAATLSRVMGPDYLAYKKAGVETLDLIALAVGRTVLVMVSSPRPPFTPDEFDLVVKRCCEMATAERDAVFARKQ